MSTDSTELTFVRCPSCRSLVPAISSRCRMCGATIDAAVKPEEPERAIRPPSRVRQRTMSQPGSELSDVSQRMREEDEINATHDALAVPDDVPSTAADDNGIAEESSETEAPPVHAAESGAAAPEVSGGDVDLGPLGAFLAGDAPAPKVAAPQVVTPPVDDEMDFDDAVSEENTWSAEDAAAEEYEEPKPAPRAERPVAPPKPIPAETDPGLIVESGARGGKRGGGLSFGAGATEAPAPRAAKREQSQPTRETHRPERKQEREEPRRSRESERSVERVEPARRREQRPVSNEDDAASAHPGRLFGWLVSYADPDGTAIEIREGNFFISRQPRRDVDLIIDDESISSPHALCKVSAKLGFLVQDVLSERGVFVRRRGTEVYQREEEAVRVEHGDWLRLGDLEYLVSLIAHVGEA